MRNHFVGYNFGEVGESRLPWPRVLTGHDPTPLVVRLAASAGACATALRDAAQVVRKATEAIAAASNVLRAPQDAVVCWPDADPKAEALLASIPSIHDDINVAMRVPPECMPDDPLSHTTGLETFLRDVQDKEER